MTLPDEARLIAALEATWPAAEVHQRPPWAIRNGAGGGKRVSAASLHGSADSTDIDRAEKEMRALGQAPIFRITAADPTSYERHLSRRKYDIRDRTIFYCSPVRALLSPDQAPLDAVASPVCLGIHAHLWAQCGIGAPRLAVMDRAPAPRAWLLGRKEDRAAGVAFAAVDGDVLMVHAIEVLGRFRRRGVGRALLHRAAKWGIAHGARHAALAVVEANAPARALYDRLGMMTRGGYHYRMKPGSTLQ